MNNLFFVYHSFKHRPLYLFTCMSILLISGCAQLPETQQEKLSNTNHLARKAQLEQLDNWRIRGKIAFIQRCTENDCQGKKDKRESVNLNWQMRADNQELKLNTFLGINVLSLESRALGSENELHELEVDGETYQSDNLDRLIWQLTGLNFPSEALSYWIKALPYSNQDTMTFSKETQLPVSMKSFYSGQEWLVSFSRYKAINGFALPTMLTIEQNGLLIKLSISKWTI
ncbi:MAG: lipoprotein insertase outer membrane protein LolB [Thalassotalea sp.]|nr:lipoprotein insertase outer membrane protein LolB [Thalassotalea sp.]